MPQHILQINNHPHLHNKNINASSASRSALGAAGGEDKHAPQQQQQQTSNRLNASLAFRLRRYTVAKHISMPSMPADDNKLKLGLSSHHADLHPNPNLVKKQLLQLQPTAKNGSPYTVDPRRTSGSVVVDFDVLTEISSQMDVGSLQLENNDDRGTREIRIPFVKSSKEEIFTDHEPVLVEEETKDQPEAAFENTDNSIEERAGEPSDPSLLSPENILEGEAKSISSIPNTINTNNSGDHQGLPPIHHDIEVEKEVEMKGPFEPSSFMAKAKHLLRNSPMPTKEMERERTKLLQRKGKVVNKYEDVRKILGWGPSLASQKEFNASSFYSTADSNHITITLKKDRIVQHSKPKALTTGVNAIRNSLGAKEVSISMTSYESPSSR